MDIGGVEMDGERITGKFKELTLNAKVKALNATEKVLTGTGKAVDGASDLADDIGEKVGSAIDGMKDLKTKKQNTQEEGKDKKISLDVMLQNAIDEYNLAFTEMNDSGIRLYVIRERAQDLILHIENLINSIANHPKSFDSDIEQIKMYRERFQGVCDFAEGELAVAKKSAIGAGSGVATGAAVASVAPTAAMWIATTFGTASTGTAISSLSGAAATNAALAWLGGGTLAAGGGGMTAGTAFLALAGPVGWSIAGVTIFASVALFAKNKMKTNKDKNEEIENIKKNCESVRESALKIEIIHQKTEELMTRLVGMYDTCLPHYEKSFMDISEMSQTELGVLVNNTKSLAASLGETL